MPGSPPWTWRPRATSRSPHASSCPRTGPRPGCTPDRPRRGWRAGDPGSAPGRRSCRRETCRWRCPKRHPSSLPSRRFFLRWCSDSWTRGPVPAAGGTRRRGVLLEALELRRDGLDTAGDVTALGLPVALLLAERCDFLEQGAGVLPLELRLRFLEPLLELGALGHEQRAHAHGGRGPGTPVAHGGRRRAGMRRSTEGAGMNQTAVVATDLDRLAERVERAAALLVELRGKNAQLEQERSLLMTERAQLQKRLEESQSKLQGQDPGALLQEVAALRKEQRDWQAERRDVASRIEAISAKLERLE